MITIYSAGEAPPDILSTLMSEQAKDLRWVIVHGYPTPVDWQEDLLADRLEGVLARLAPKADAESWETKRDTARQKVRFVTYGD